MLIDTVRITEDQRMLYTYHYAQGPLSQPRGRHLSIYSRLQAHSAALRAPNHFWRSLRSHSPATTTGIPSAAQDIGQFAKFGYVALELIRNCTLTLSVYSPNESERAW